MKCCLISATLLAFFVFADASGSIRSGVQAGFAPCQLAPTFSTFSRFVSYSTGTAVPEDWWLYYDPFSQFMRIDISLKQSGQTVAYTNWYDYKSQVLWTLDYQNNNCYKYGLTGTLPIPVIPLNANLTGLSTIAGVDCQKWQFSAQGITYTFTVTEGSCFNVHQTAVNQTTNTVQFDQTYENFIPTVSPFEFYVSPDCYSASKDGWEWHASKKPGTYSPPGPNFQPFFSLH